MGVIKKNDAKLGHFQTSSEESLHIPQPSDDDCSVASIPILVRDVDHNSGAVPRRRLAVPTSHSDARRNFGKKRLRRYNNVNQLMTLLEEDELGEVTINDLIPNTRRGFIHILNDDSAYQAWDSFVHSSEELQNEILHLNDSRPRVASVPFAAKEPTGDEAFQNIKSGLRNKLKKSQIPQGMLDYLEKSLVDFFIESPEEVFFSESTTSFERLLLHAVSQYHRLVSQSVDSEQKKMRLVQVYNPSNVFKLPTILLGQYLVLRRKPAESVK